MKERLKMDIELQENLQNNWDQGNRINRKHSHKEVKRNSLQQNASQLLQFNESNGGILEAILEDPKPRRTKKRLQQKSALTRDGLKASQNLIEYSISNQLNQNPSNNLLNNSSAVFDPQSEVLKFATLRNNKVIHREEPDYSRKHTIQNMMAKRQKAAHQIQ